MMFNNLQSAGLQGGPLTGCRLHNTMQSGAASNKMTQLLKCNKKSTGANIVHLAN